MLRTVTSARRIDHPLLPRAGPKKGEGGTGDTQIKSERPLYSARNIESHSMPRIRIVCIGDTHGQHAKLDVPDGDVLTRIES